MPGGLLREEIGEILTIYTIAQSWRTILFGISSWTKSNHSQRRANQGPGPEEGTMKRLGHYVFFLVIILLSACAVAACGPRGEPVQPGDTVGLVTVTTGTTADYPAPGTFNCTKQGDKGDYSCVATVGQRLNISIAIYDNNYILNDDDDFEGLELEQKWEEHTYELFIDNRPVDLAAFGTLDMVHPSYGFMRMWNVVIVASEPGEVTVRGKGQADGKPFDITQKISFSAGK